MTTTPVTITVDSQTAAAYAAAPIEERRKIELLLNLRLRELTVDPQKPLRKIMDETGAEAQHNGLTVEILTELLHRD